MIHKLKLKFSQRFPIRRTTEFKNFNTILQCFSKYPFKRQLHKMVEHSQTVVWVCLTILRGWRLKGYEDVLGSSQPLLEALQKCVKIFQPGQPFNLCLLWGWGRKRLHFQRLHFTKGMTKGYLHLWYFAWFGIICTI